MTPATGFAGAGQLGHGDVRCGLQRALCNNLVELLPDEACPPAIWRKAGATDEGAARWTFILRKGVKFHDGRPFTPEDARQSLLHHMGEGSTSGALSIVSQISDIAIEGEDRLIVTLSQGNADFPICCRITISRSSVPIGEAARIDWESAAWAPAPSGSDSFEPGVAVSMSRNPGLSQAGPAAFR